MGAGESGEEGPRGKTGADGVGIKSASLNATTGNLTFVLTDDKTTMGPFMVRGPAGDGIKTIQITSGNMIFKTDAGLERIVSITNLKGIDGINGTMGPVGPKGATGERGAAGRDADEIPYALFIPSTGLCMTQGTRPSVCVSTNTAQRFFYNPISKRLVNNDKKCLQNATSGTDWLTCNSSERQTFTHLPDSAGRLGNELLTESWGTTSLTSTSTPKFAFRPL